MDEKRNKEKKNFMKLNIKKTIKMKKKELFRIFIWRIFNRKKYAKYKEYLALGLTQRAVYFEVKNNI